MKFSVQVHEIHEIHEISTDCFMKSGALINLPYKHIIGFSNFHELQVNKNTDNWQFM